MDGKKLTRLFLDSVDEDEVSVQYAQQRKIYEALDWACALFIRETGILHTTVEITTVASQQEYDVPPDFIDLYMKNKRGRFIGKYYDGSNYSWPYLTEYEKIYKRNLSDSKSWPTNFSIIDKPTKETLIEGTATATNASSGGQATLEDTSMDFDGTNLVYPRDIIHNTTQSTNGYVLSVTDSNNIVVALFDSDGAESSGITLADSYKIQPATEYQLVLDAPSESASHTLELPYICMPSPVFSDYGWWRINPRSCRAIASGAASIFKKFEKEFVDSAQIGGLFAEEVSRTKMEVAKNKLLDRSRYREVM